MTMAMPHGAASVFLRGFTVVASATLSLGPQNPFVLRRGLARRHTVLTVAVCFGSDVMLMSSAVLGFGARLMSSFFARPAFCRAFDASAAAAMAGMVAMLL